VFEYKQAQEVRDDIIASKEAAKRRKDLDSLPRLKAFRDYWLAKNRKRES
jgi:hypothetical protein